MVSIAILGMGLAVRSEPETEEARICSFRDEERRVDRDAKLVQAIEGFCLIALVKLKANGPEQTSETFRAGFTVVHDSANLRK